MLQQSWEQMPVGGPNAEEDLKKKNRLRPSSHVTKEEVLKSLFMAVQNMEGHLH